MLLTLQLALQGACYGDAAGFAAVLEQLTPTGVPADKALYVHTATVTAALTGLLAEAYPAVRVRLGAADFDDLALAHLRASPPGPAILSAYGAGFGDRLPLSLHPAAAADWAAHLAYFAADAAPMAPEALAAVPPAALADLCLPLVPSAGLVLGDRTALQEWQGDRPDIRLLPPPLPIDGPTAMALIWRAPDLLVTATLLPAQAGPFLQALAHGIPLLAAAAELPDSDSLPLLLALLLGQGLIAAPRPRDPVTS